MLSATPVNNRLTDLRNQIAFATEGDDTALADYGIDSIQQTTRKAQIQFNRWLGLEENERTPSRLVEMLGFDYFTLLDHRPSPGRAGTSRSTTAPGDRPLSPTAGRPSTSRPIGPGGPVPPSTTSTWRSGAEPGRLRAAALRAAARLRPPTTPMYSTEIRGGEASSARLDRERASSTCCG